MTRLRTRLAAFTPRAVAPLARRQLRRLDRLCGLLKSGRRPGVVLMLHVGRCGSTVLANLLAQNPRIYWDGKLPRVARELYGDRLAALDFPAWARRQFAISGARYYGFEFKVLADQYPALIGLSTAAFLEACREIGVTHYILLVRRNTLRHVVSHYASRHRGSWHASEQGAAKKKSFALDVADITTGSAPGRPLVEYLREVDDMHETVRRTLAGERLLEIEYEADIDAAGAPHAYARVCEFLGIPPVAADVRNARMNPFPLDGVLDNYDEVVRTLEGSGFEWMARG